MTLGLLAIGEVMAEIRQSPDTGYDVGFAGDTFNTAVYCQRNLESSVKVGFMSRVGTDPLSQSLVKFAEDEALDTESIAIDDDANIGIYSVSTDSAGERSFHYWRSQSAARQMFSDASSIKTIPAARILYLSGITLAILHPDARRRLIDHLKSVSSAGQSLVAFDSNYRPRLWESEGVAQEIMSEMWGFADIGLPSIDDEMNLFGETSEAAVVDRFSSRSWSACAIKRGSEGPLSTNNLGSDTPTFEPATQVIDTTAAGDSFNGGYLAAYLSDRSEADCLLAGHQCAAAVVGVRGAISPKPD